MKIYISIDMEGIAGTINWHQEEVDRQDVRRYMTQQIEWIIDGIRKSSVNDKIDEIVVADSHGRGDNLTYDLTKIDDRLHLISGSPRPQYMMPAFSDYYSIVFLVGYHAGVGKLHGNMDHTYSLRIHKILINDMPMNETLINAAYAGYFKVPVGLIIGDDALQKELIAENNMPWINYVTTKYAISRFAVKQRPFEKVRLDTINKVKRVLERDLSSIPIYKFESPTRLKIEFNTTSMADGACLMPNVTRINGTTIEYSHDDYKILFDAILALAFLADVSSS